MTPICHICAQNAAFNSCPHCKLRFCSAECFHSHSECNDKNFSRNDPLSHEASLQNLFVKYRSEREGIEACLSRPIDEDEMLKELEIEGRTKFYICVQKTMASYIPWFAKVPPIPPCSPLEDHFSETGSSREPFIWFNLFDVLFWYCCLQRKDLGSAPNEIELIDASPILSGMIDVYPSFTACVEHIRGAMAFFFPDSKFQHLLLEPSFQDVSFLLQSPKNCFIALCHLYTATCKNAQKHAHGRRLYKLIGWLCLQPEDKKTNRLQELHGEMEKNELCHIR